MVAERNATVIKHASDIPTKAFVVERHAASKADTGVGEPLAASSVHKAWPLEMAKLTHPMHIKSSIHIARPLQSRGAMLMGLWKENDRFRASNHSEMSQSLIRMPRRQALMNAASFLML